VLAGVSLVWQPVWWPRVLLPGLVPMAVAVGAAAAAWPVRWHGAGRAASCALALVIAAGGATWLVRDSRVAIEPWDAVAVAFGDAAAAPALAPTVAPLNVPTIAVPEYAAWPLERRSTVDRAIALRLPTPPSALRDRLAPAVDALRSGGTARLVVRADLTLRRHPGAVAAVAAVLAGARGTSRGRVQVAVVLSPDVSLVPPLRDTAQQAEAALVAAFGAPLRRSTARGVTLLAF
jgi:hypothetical protein